MHELTIAIVVPPRSAARLRGHIPVRRCWLPALLLLSMLAVAGTVLAQDDTRRLLEQGSLQQSIEREQELLAQDGERPTLTVDGTTYRVEHTANDVGQALYLMLQRRQWTLARKFLDEYLTLPERDPLLEHYAQGLLARADGDHATAISELRAVLARQPDFLLARLELARTLFEDQQDREAAEVFEAIAVSLADDVDRNAGVLRTVAVFRQALDKREAWSGSASLGPTWSDNVNRSSASSICVFLVGGQCLVDRRTPDKIRAAGMDYDATLNRRLALAGHHGLYLRSLLYGQSYRGAGRYNEASVAVQGGYSYRSARHVLMFAPTFDYYGWGNQALYGAWGAHAEWNWTPSRTALLRVELDWKDLRYRTPLLAANYDGPMRAVSATYFRSLGPRWTLFAGVDLTASGAPQAINAYQQRGARLGASLQWPEGFNSTAMASLRERSHDAYSALLQERRHDDEQNYTLVIKANRWAMSGFTPVLTLRRNVIRSNVGWLYSHDRDVASLKLERTF